VEPKVFLLLFLQKKKNPFFRLGRREFLAGAVATGVAAGNPQKCFE
jgi:hypothetical protein